MKYRFYLYTLLTICLTLSACSKPSVKVGLDNIESHLRIFEGKRVGIITNHTAYNSQGQHIIDVFRNLPGIKITALFGPEHGIHGEEAAGGKIDDDVDPVKQIPIYSLYGKTLKPTPEMLEKVDVLVFDIQDIGARFYTYIWTMTLAIEAAAEQGKQFVVLDRPNPITGTLVEGTVLDTSFATFVGLYPIPVRHGMTVGELASMFNEEGWLKNGVKADLTIIPVRNWKRSMWYDETALKWRKTSPNIPNLDIAAVYPGMCLFEGTNISEGRGTYEPFLQFGAPWIDGNALAKALIAYQLPGVSFQPNQFTPVTIPGMAHHPKFEREGCNGVKLSITDRNSFNAFQTGIACVKAIHDLYPDKLRWRIRHFDRLCGTDNIRKQIIDSASYQEIIKGWQEELDEFRVLRSKHLMYK